MSLSILMLWEIFGIATEHNTCICDRSGRKFILSVFSNFLIESKAFFKKNGCNGKKFAFQVNSGVLNASVSGPHSVRVKIVWSHVWVPNTANSSLQILDTLKKNHDSFSPFWPNAILSTAESKKNTYLRVLTCSFLEYKPFSVFFTFQLYSYWWFRVLQVFSIGQR